jgi:hypothetical protein
MPGWYALVGHEVVGPFETLDPWYHEHGGPDWRMIEWRRSGADPWRVERTLLPDGRAVSTVFLGLDHSWWPDSPPHLFETMVLPDAELVERCSTWEQAERQHADAVASLRYA